MYWYSTSLHVQSVRKHYSKSLEALRVFSENAVLIYIRKPLIFRKASVRIDQV